MNTNRFKVASSSLSVIKYNGTQTMEIRMASRIAKLAAFFTHQSVSPNSHDISSSINDELSSQKLSANISSVEVY